MQLLVGRLARGDHDQQPPEVVTIAEPIEPAMSGAVAEALESALGHVLAVDDAGTMRELPELVVGQPDEPVEMRLRGVAASSSPSFRSWTQRVTEPPGGPS